MITLLPLDRTGLAAAQQWVMRAHYLHRPVDPRTMPEGYSVHLAEAGRIGVLLFGRPEATRCYPWYGSLADVASGRAQVSRWQVLNLARVLLDPRVQIGGQLYDSAILPGFVDRRGVWRSTLASTVVRLALERIGYDYLVRRPPVWIHEPYIIASVLSYCDPAYHRGTLYSAAGFRLERVNARGLQTWRSEIPPLTPAQDVHVRQLAEQHPRSRALRSRHTAPPRQLALQIA